MKRNNGHLSGETWLGTAEVAERLGCHTSTVVRRIEKGLIPARYVDNRYEVAESALEQQERLSGARAAEVPNAGAPADEVNPSDGLFGELRPLMTYAYVAEYLGASIGQVRQMVALGQLGSVPYGQQRRITVIALQRYLSGQAA